MKLSKLTLFLALCVLSAALTSCDDWHRYDPNAGRQLPDSSIPMVLLDSIGWSWERKCPVDLSKAAYSVTSDTMRLHFFGWSAEEDSAFLVSFPDDPSQYGRAILSYRMGGWNKGPADWDMTTMIMMQDPSSQEWYEISRMITPYGGRFGANWDTIYHLDVTEFLPMMRGDAKFRIFYCGWDATSTRAHTAALTFSLYKGKCLYGTPIGREKIYDSTLNGNTGYRSWAYGVTDSIDPMLHSIEHADRLGQRTLNVPAGTRRIILRSCLTGHGQDALTKHQGKLTNFEGVSKKGNSTAEFDKNEYRIVLGGDTIAQRGLLWELNSAEYSYQQAGTWTYSRCGWGPGKPANVHHWVINEIPADGRLTIDFDLYQYTSTNTAPNAESVAQFYVEVDAFYYQ